jgi:hypothetical protein
VLLALLAHLIIFKTDIMLLKPAVKFLDVPIRPLLYGAKTEVQRVLRYHKMTPVQNIVTGEFSNVAIAYVLHFCTNDDGTAGDPFTEIPSYPVPLSADDSWAVNLATGKAEVSRQQGEQQPDFEARVHALDGTYILQGAAMREVFFNPSPDQGLYAMVEEAMRDADGPPWYKFGGAPV